MIKQHVTQEMERCICECMACYEACLQAAVNHQLGLDGPNLDPAHVRLLLSCAEICQTTAHVMLTGSPLSKPAGRICAKVCRRCAVECEAYAELAYCVKACRVSAEWCQRIAA